MSTCGAQFLRTVQRGKRRNTTVFTHALPRNSPPHATENEAQQPNSPSTRNTNTPAHLRRPHGRTPRPRAKQATPTSQTAKAYGPSLTRQQQDLLALEHCPPDRIEEFGWGLRVLPLAGQHPVDVIIEISVLCDTHESQTPPAAQAPACCRGGGGGGRRLPSTMLHVPSFAYKRGGGSLY